MRIQTFGPGTFALRMVGNHRRWQHVYVTQVVSDNRYLCVRHVLPARWWHRATGSFAPVLGEEFETGAGLSIPECLVRFPWSRRRRYVAHGTTWAWRQDSSSEGEFTDVLPNEAWHVWPVVQASLRARD